MFLSELHILNSCRFFSISVSQRALEQDHKEDTNNRSAVLCASASSLILMWWHTPTHTHTHTHTHTDTCYKGSGARYSGSDSTTTYKHWTFNTPI
jgi:hypothetical protein